VADEICALAPEMVLSAEAWRRGRVRVSRCRPGGTEVAVAVEAWFERGVPGRRPSPGRSRFNWW
jgi:hypothetical protein